MSAHSLQRAAWCTFFYLTLRLFTFFCVDCLLSVSFLSCSGDMPAVCGAKTCLMFPGLTAPSLCSLVLRYVVIIFIILSHWLSFQLKCLTWCTSVVNHTSPSQVSQEKEQVRIEHNATMSFLIHSQPEQLLFLPNISLKKPRPGELFSHVSSCCKTMWSNLTEPKRTSKPRMHSWFLHVTVRQAN